MITRSMATAGALLMTCAGSVAAQVQSRPAEIPSDTWAATDALGRTLVTHEQAGPPRPDKFVGVFYFLWMGQHGTDGPYDITRILARDPQAMKNPASPLWGPSHHYHYWGEPLFGYYLSDDRWVLRKHGQMLADAGVDVIIFDVTNQVTYKKVYTALCEVFTQVRKQGGQTPQIAFLTPFWDPSKVVAELYTDLYKPGRYPDLWFQWKGKPLILADPAKVPPETKEFFTFRKPQPDYFKGPTGPDQWGWLEVHPQHAFENAEGKPEQVTVGVGQNASARGLSAFSEKNTFGRSWHNGKKDERKDAVLHGLNITEQWKRALEIDPEFIFITGWNEWIAMRLPEFAGAREPVMFVDQFTQEYSRDIEPMKGGHADNYYYQMVDYIRWFKGIRPPPTAAPATTVRIDGRFADWKDVPAYRDDRGDTMHRDHPGYDQVGQYVNRSGRNDLVLLKAARDERFVYFYAQTAEPITSSKDPHWMMLFIDADGNHKTGWEGYDLLVNRTVRDPNTTTIEYSTGAWKWQRRGRAEYRVGGNELELAIPRSAMSSKAAAAPASLHFKWVDHLQAEGDVMDFTVNGDAAPNGRFNYVLPLK